MPLSEFELIMLDDGGKHIEVAKSMMDAGIQTAFELNEETVPLSSDADEKRNILH